MKSKRFVKVDVKMIMPEKAQLTNNTIYLRPEDIESVNQDEEKFIIITKTGKRYFYYGDGQTLFDDIELAERYVLSRDNRLVAWSSMLS